MSSKVIRVGSTINQADGVLVRDKKTGGTLEAGGERTEWSQGNVAEQRPGTGAQFPEGGATYRQGGEEGIRFAFIGSGIEYKI